MGDLRSMLNPKAVALIGASDEEGSIGCAILKNLLSSKHRQILAVNPNRKQAFGLDCYPSIGDIGKPVDCAVIATPAASVPDAVEQCGKAGAEGTIIISAGFREAGAEGKRLEDRLVEIRNRYGLRIIGPNCLGVMLPHIGLNATFLKTNPQPGNLAFISQSGALGDAIVDWGANSNIGFSLFVSLGSMIDVDFGDLIDLVQDDYFTKSIMIYMEHVGNAKKFISSARGFARNKPIVVLKPGRLRESATALMAHTGLDIGDDRVYDAAFKRVGIVRVKETRDLFDTCGVLVSRDLPRGPRLAIVTNSGSVGILANDALVELQGQLARLSAESLRELSMVLPSPYFENNPIDIQGDANIERYAKAIDVCLNDTGVDGVLVAYTPRAEVEPDRLAQAITEMAAKTRKPIIAIWMGGEYAYKGKKVFFEKSIPVYDTPEEAVRAYLYMYSYQRNTRFLNETPDELSVNQGRLKNYLKVIVHNTMRNGLFSLPPEQTMDLLKNYGIPVAKTSVANSAEEAVVAARQMGFPVALRLVAGDGHTEKDMVTGIRSEGGTREGYNTLAHTAGHGRSDLSRVQVAVQKMPEDIDHEFLLRVNKDIDFGSAIFFGHYTGRGGVDGSGYSVGLPPLNQVLARGLIEDIGLNALAQHDDDALQSIWRQLEELLVSCSNVITDFPEMAAMELAPIALSMGKVSVLDARIHLERDYVAGASKYPHLVITPYPAQYVIPWALKDGTEVIIRPIRAEDEPLAREMIASLSEETLRVRFFVIREITHKMLMQFCNVDYDKEMAFVAELKDGAKKMLIGGGRLIIEPGFERGQFAVLIHDDFHGKGLGEKLLDILIGVAQERGLKEVYAIVLSENEKMLRVCRKMGFTPHLLPDGITRVSLSLG